MWLLIIFDFPLSRCQLITVNELLGGLVGDFRKENGMENRGRGEGRFRTSFSQTNQVGGLVVSSIFLPVACDSTSLPNPTLAVIAISARKKTWPQEEPHRELFVNVTGGTKHLLATNIMSWKSVLKHFPLFCRDFFLRLAITSSHRQTPSWGTISSLIIVTIIGVMVVVMVGLFLAPTWQKDPLQDVHP